MKRSMRGDKPGRMDTRPGPQPERPAAASSWLPWAAGLVILVATAGATWALFEFVILSRIPGALVGKWVVEGGEQDGATFDFYRDGTMRGRINVGGKEGIIHARVRVEGDKMHTTTRNPSTGKDETRTQTIRSLSERELVLADDRGEVLRMTRAD